MPTLPDSTQLITKAPHTWGVGEQGQWSNQSPPHLGGWGASAIAARLKLAVRRLAIVINALRKTFHFLISRNPSNLHQAGEIIPQTARGYSYYQ